MRIATISITMMIPIDVTVLGIMMLVIGHPKNMKSVMAVALLAIVATVDVSRVYRLLPGSA